MMNKEYEESELDEQLDDQDQSIAPDGEPVDEALDAVQSEGDEPEESMTYEELQNRVHELEEINAKMADQFVRAKAETENTRRIKEQEVSRARKFALEGFSKELLQVKDSLDQASLVQLSDDSEQSLVEQMQSGLVLTLRQLDSVFERFHIDEVMPEAGDDLDSELHQPMTMQASEDIAKNKVIQTIQKGYTLNDRLLRAAMVIVSSGPA